ncbi:MAG TPA: MFS transporter [Gaiellaceae bacterium]|nr:MFS transporter [Gaiellaceae bacterium]
MPFERILAAIDGSQASDRAFAKALELARLVGARLPGAARRESAAPEGRARRARRAKPTPAPGRPAPANGLSPLRFVVVFGLVSALADFVYEGGRSIVGPYLATLGASPEAVGVITGAGEAVALVFRLGAGALADRTRRHWALSIAGYLLTLVSVPLLAVAKQLPAAATLVVAERFGKAVRTPARDTMLAQASTGLGRGFAFGLHEALDQSGALVGLFVVALVLALGGGFAAGFAVLAVPGALALALLTRLRLGAPAPSAYEDGADEKGQTRAPPGRLRAGERRRLLLYGAFAALTMLGFATFAVLAYHLQVRHVVPEWQIPLVYALAMGVDGLAALAAGRSYDRIGLRGLAVLPLLSAAVPLLSFSTSAPLVWAGAAVWGAAMGIQETTMRAAVADLVPRERRATGYGAFTAVYGLAWLAGSAVLGALYGHSVEAAIAFALVVQALALAAFLPLALERRHGGWQ